MGAFNRIEKMMKLSKEKRLLIMLNHSSRELLQIMDAIQSKLEAYDKPNSEVERLNLTLDFTWKTIMLQINDVSNYLNYDEDVLQAYSEARAENSASSVIQYHDFGNDDQILAK